MAWQTLLNREKGNADSRALTITLAKEIFPHNRFSHYWGMLFSYIRDNDHIGLAVIAGFCYTIARCLLYVVGAVCNDKFVLQQMCSG